MKQKKKSPFSNIFLLSRGRIRIANLKTPMYKVKTKNQEKTPELQLRLI